VRKLYGIAVILAAGALWGASPTFADSLPSSQSPSVLKPIIDVPPVAEMPIIPGPNSVNLVPVDSNGNPVAKTDPATMTPAPASKPAPTAKVAPTTTQPTSAASAAAGAANALAAQGSTQLKSVKKVIGVVDDANVTLDAEAAFRTSEEPALPFGAPKPSVPSASVPSASVPAGVEYPLADQTAANVPLDAYEFDPANPGATPVKRVQIPVEPLPEGPSAQSETFELPLNKTRPIELDRNVRDVILGNPEIADVVVRAPGEVYLIGRAVGQTNVFLVDAGGKLVRKVEVVVNPDGSSVEAAIRQLMPKERINARGVGDSVILSGVASSDGAAAQAQQIARRFVPADENIVNMITVGSEQQVLIRVKVAEIQKSVLKELGAAADFIAQDLGPLTLDLATAATGLSASTFAGVIGLSSDNVDATFQLLETQGFLRTLAEPNLLAISGEPASMLAGGEYPVVAVNSDSGDATVSVEYKPFGVSLAFLPVVIAPGRIWLKVSTEVSALSQQNSVVIPFGEDSFQILGLATRRANSTIELPSGGGIMIAGLLQNDIQSTVNGVPGLMDLPILGSLFRSTSFQRNETELVILVSVLLAKPVDPDLLAAPTDGFAPSHDLDRYFIGNLQDIYVKDAPAESLPPEGPKGPIGYIIN
jgi:pilus assembly protein CpaC